MTQKKLAFLPWGEFSAYFWVSLGSLSAELQLLYINPQNLWGFCSGGARVLICSGFFFTVTMVPNNHWKYSMFVLVVCTVSLEANGGVPVVYTSHDQQPGMMSHCSWCADLTSIIAACLVLPCYTYTHVVPVLFLFFIFLTIYGLSSPTAISTLLLMVSPYQLFWLGPN